MRDCGCQSNAAASSVAAADANGAALPLRMGKNSLRKRVRSLEGRIAEHQAKLLREATCPNPNDGVIHHWFVELQAFQGSLDRARKRRPSA